MKKSILFLACCIGLMFFASCKKDVQPTINVVADPGYVNQGSQVFSGDPILVGFTVAGENLIQITLIAEQDGAAIYTYSEALENVAAFNFAKSVTLEASGTVSIRGTTPRVTRPPRVSTSATTRSPTRSLWATMKATSSSRVWSTSSSWAPL